MCQFWEGVALINVSKVVRALHSYIGFHQSEFHPQLSLISPCFSIFLPIFIYSLVVPNPPDFIRLRIYLFINWKKQDQKVEYRLKGKNLDKFHQGSITITCSRYYNPITGNIKLFKPMDQGYWKYEQKYNLTTLFQIIDRFKAFEVPDMKPVRFF